jgi:hypothetical protein
MFTLNDFFNSKPLSPEGESPQQPEPIQRVTGWKPKHDPSYYDNKIPEKEVEQPALLLEDLVPEGSLAERPPVNLFLPKSLIRPEHAEAAREAKRQRREQKEQKKLQRKQAAALKEQERLGRIPPLNPTLTGTEAALDTFLRRHKRCIELTRNKTILVEILEEIHSRQEFYLDKLELYVKRLFDLTKTAKEWDVIVPGIGQTLVANLIGYWSFADMKAASLVNRNKVKNLRFGMELGFMEEKELLQVKDAAEVLRKKNAGIATKGRLRRDQTEVYNGTQLAGKFNSGQINELLNDYVAMYRTPRLVGDKDELKAIAVKRFFEMDSVDDLTPYLIAKVFPPSFKPRNVEQKETRLFFHIRSAMLKDEKFNAMTAYLKLKPWCATPEIDQELERVIGEMAGGKPQRWAQFIRRKYGVVLLVLDHRAGIGLITENEKIVRIVKLKLKEARDEQDNEDSIDTIPEDERQPDFADPDERPRITLTSHDPAFANAFKELHNRNK